MRLKALGAATALILTSIAFATVVATRIQARGHATNSSNTRLDFQFRGLHIDNSGNHRYIGQGGFAWTANGRTQSMRVRTISSITVEEDGDERVITIEGTGQLGRWGFAPSRYSNNLMVGNFTAIFTDNSEDSDTVIFSFTSGSGVSAFNYHFSGTVQSGVLNVNQWTL